MSGQTVRRPLLVHTLLEVLVEAGHPVRAADAIELVRQRVTLNEPERSVDKSGHQRFATALQHSSTSLQNAGWLTKGAGAWESTDVGRKALATASGPDELFSLLSRQRTHGSSHKAKLSLVDQVLADLPAGRWVSLDDLAQSLDVDPGAISERLLALRPRNWHRVLGSHGLLDPVMASAEDAQRDLLAERRPVPDAGLLHDLRAPPRTPAVRGRSG